MIVLRIAGFGVRFVLGTVRLTTRAGYRTARAGAVAGARTAAASARAGYATGRAVGYGRTAVFAAGVTVGVLVASPSARAGVRRVGSTVWSLRGRWRGPTDEVIADQVRRRIAGANATWNLPQPRITVIDGRVLLDGDVPDQASSRAIAETASEVDGVREVDNRLMVRVSRPADENSPSSSGERVPDAVHGDGDAPAATDPGGSDPGGSGPA